MRFLLTLILVLVLSSTFLAARPGNDPNAAVRYLNAVGFLPELSLEAVKRIENIDSLEEFKKLGSDSLALLADFQTGKAMKLLELGAACPGCNFTPDDTNSFDDMVPPFRRIRQLARIAQAYAWKCETDGDLERAFSLLTSTFMLGQHVEDNRLLISTMVGIACRKIALSALKDMAARHPEFPWKERLAAFFKRIPRPAVDIRASLTYERQGLEDNLRKAKAHPEMFGPKLTYWVPEEMVASIAAVVRSMETGGRLITESAGCRKARRLTNGAMEMLMMDHPGPFPATITADPMGSLVALHYLPKAAACPGTGAIAITLGGPDGYSVACSSHGNGFAEAPPLPGEAMVPAPKSWTENEREALAAEYLRKIAPTDEYDRLLAGVLALYDEILALDPNASDFGDRCDALRKRVNASDNLLVVNCIPNLRKIHENAMQVQKGIDNLLK